MSRKFDELSKKISEASLAINDAREKIQNGVDDLISPELENLITETTILEEDCKRLLHALRSTSTINSIISK